jgi:hypothetical protein
VTGPHGSSFSGRVGWGDRPAVLVIDLVRAYTEPGGPFELPDPGSAVSATAELVDAARAGGHLVVWTVVRYSPDLVDGGLFARKVPALAAFAEGTPGGWGELTLKPQPGEPVVVKQYASAFFGTSLASSCTLWAWTPWSSPASRRPAASEPLPPTRSGTACVHRWCGRRAPTAHRPSTNPTSPTSTPSTPT